MNRVDYINALKNALEIRKEEREEIEQYHKMVLGYFDNAQLNTFISLVEFISAFYNPVNRVLNLITNRLLEEHLYDWDISKCSFTLMTIENVYENMTQDISLDTSCDIIIDKHLVCCSYAKSELIRSIKERNLQLFKDIIKEYNIDYKPASDICSHICLNSNIQRDIPNKFDKVAEEYRDAEALHKEDISKGYSLRYRAICEDVQSKMIKKFREDGWSDKDVTDLNHIIEKVKVLECPLDVSSPDTLIDSMTIICKRCFYQSVHSLSTNAKAHKLNEYDKSLIGTFIEKKKTEMPIVQEYFTLLTKGNVLGDDFVFTEAEDAEFLEMIEQCVYAETNEQQMLPNNGNTGIGYLEPVDNPKLEELKTSNENDSNRFIYSHIRGFIKVEDVEGFLKHLHKMIEEQDRYCKRIFVIRAAWKTGKIESPCQRYKEYTKEFPDMFGTKQQWSKYMNQKKYNDDCDEISRFIPYFDNW